MTEYLVCAPVLLAGEDVPTRSIIGKLVRTDLAIKGELLAEDLPRFPVLQWLQYLARLPKRQIQEEYEANRARCLAKSRASGRDDGATRMAWNYAALLTAWRYLADFVGLSFDYGNLEQDLMATMNAHVEETSADREPWVWILEIVLSEMERGDYR